MIGLDTNVRVRYVVQDHPDQAARATELIETECGTGNPGLHYSSPSSTSSSRAPLR